MSIFISEYPITQYVSKKKSEVEIELKSKSQAEIESLDSNE